MYMLVQSSVMAGRYIAETVVLIFLVALCSAASISKEETCTTTIYLDSGRVCTSRLLSNDDGVEFASFRGIPYAKQPLGELRFKELQPVEPWNTTLDASENGPVCPQYDYYYETLFGPKNSSESCILANIHVPVAAIPPANMIELELRPILVFVHGGAFAFGSGDDDLHGPENFMSKDVIVVTFNYRLNVFGFLSLNSTYIPGNNGIRDIITLLRWVKRNARAFGGNPEDITIAGQSSGAVLITYLNVSPAVQGEGLYKRIISMSGAPARSFNTATPAYSQSMANNFLAALNITSTDPAEVHQQLIDLPLETIMAVHNTLLNTTGFILFSPVVESQLENVTQILDNLPENLILQGRGKDTPILVGFTSAEAETFHARMESLNFAAVIQANSALLSPLELIYGRTTNVSAQVATLTDQRYFNGTVDYNRMVTWLSEIGFQYSALKSASLLAEQGTAFLYQFDYTPDYNIIRNSRNYTGAGHIEDLTYVFRPHSSILDDAKYSERDRQMMNWMTTIFTNFMKCSKPTCEESSWRSWPAVNSSGLLLQYIDTPGRYQVRGIGERLTGLFEFGDLIFSL